MSGAGQVIGSSRQTLGRRRQLHALNLRSLGYTYEAVAQALLPCPDHRLKGRDGCEFCLPMYRSRAAAKRAVDAAMAAEYALDAGTREQYRQLQLAQIDLVLQRVMPEATAKGKDRNEAARVAERYLRQRARLLGLEAPARIQITTELDETIRELVDQLEETVGAVEPI
jgi:hypothetical protein